MAQQYRYPGAKPFNTDESHVFYGRAGVSQDLYQLIRLEPLVVLHAKSGLGKSSVINAGLMPMVAKNQEYDPYNIRFHAYTEGKQDFPLGITRDGVRSQSEVLDKIRPEGEDSLWYHLKSLQFAAEEGKGTLLIFDQFEELFTYPEEVVEEFARQLSEALYSTLPQRFRDKRKEGFENNKAFLSAEELAQLDQLLNLRLVMVIRSDRMSLMKKLKAYFPTILAADFELQPLTREQAEDAILSPAYQKVGFATPLFDYEDDAIEYLLDFLSEGDTEPIESFQLQILCEYVERHLVAKQGKTLIQKADIAQPDQILENYYLDKINAITDPTDQLAARRLIEEGFIFEEEERRLTLYEGQIFKSYGINQDLLNQLLDTHLVRSEPSLRGGYTYELSHDTLVAPVLKAKAKRKAAERLIQEKAAQQAREAELLALRQKEEVTRQQAEKEKQLRTAAEHNEKRAKQGTLLASVISIIALLLLCLASWLYNDAENVKKKQRTTLEQLNETLSSLEKEKTATIAAKDAAELRRIEAEIQTALALKNEAAAEAQTRLAQQRKLEADFAKDNALQSQAEAEASATAAQNVSLVLTIAKSNPTLALRIAEYNLKTHTGNPAAVAVFREVISDPDNIFYQEMGGHTSAVTAVSFSPDGQSILTGSSDKTAKLWDLRGNTLQVFLGHTSAITAVSFSPDGQSILTGSSDKTAKLWDLRGNALQVFLGHTSAVTAVSFSPDGQSILTGSSDHTAKLWGLRGNALQTFSGHTHPVTAVAFSPDGESILTGSSDKTAKLWDIRGNALQTFSGHTSYVTAVAFSPDGQSILTGSLDKTAKLWDVRGNALQIFLGHTSAVFAISFSPDGESILTGSSDKTAKLWDIRGNALQTFSGHTSAVTAISFSPDGESILTGSSDHTAKLWGLSGNKLQKFSGHADDVYTVTFSPDGQSILTGSEDKTAKLWDLRGKELQTFSGHTDAVFAVAFSPDGQSILTGSSDNTAKLWDLKGNALQVFLGHSFDVTAVAFSPDGQNILTGSWDNTAKLWDVRGNELQNFSGHADFVNTVGFSPDGQNILTGSFDNTAKLWDLKGKELQIFSRYASFIKPAVFSSNEQSILTENGDSTAKLWQTHEPFLDQKVKPFTLQELYDAGVILEAEDLEKVKQR
jgi:WD40 repeat protein